MTPFSPKIEKQIVALAFQCVGMSFCYMLLEKHTNGLVVLFYFTDGPTLTAENQYQEELFGSVLPLCLCSSGNFTSFLPALSWLSCDCHGDLPVTVLQEETVLDYDVKGWSLCTLELGGRCRVCIISNIYNVSISAVLCLWCSSFARTNQSVFEQSHFSKSPDHWLNP